MFVLTLTTIASFIVGLKVWGILGDKKPVEKPVVTEVPSSVELLEEWNASLDFEGKESSRDEYDRMYDISKSSDDRFNFPF